MNNDDFLNGLLQWQTILFCLGIFAITFVIRTIVEYIFPSSIVYTSKWGKTWNKLILPLMPITFGILVGWVAAKYPYPDGLTTLSARLVFGAVSGLLSGTIYQIVKGMLKAKISSTDNTTKTQ